MAFTPLELSSAQFERAKGEATTYSAPLCAGGQGSLAALGMTQFTLRMTQSFDLQLTYDDDARSQIRVTADTASSRDIVSVTTASTSLRVSSGMSL